MKNFVTINSREVAIMVEKEHSELLKDIRKYIGYFNEGKIPPVDFFVESSYIDSKGQERPCYEVTRKGCDMIANKLTGQKGTIFTATYINKFHEMESAQNQLSQPYDTTKSFSIGEVTNFLKTTVSVMKHQNSPRHKIAEQYQLTCSQFGIKMINDFVEPDPFEQMTLFVTVNN